MDLFELWATLGIDTRGFTKGLTGALQWALSAVTDFARDFARDVLETGMGFDKEMSAVQAVLGQVEGTEENMIRLREYALDQARDSIFTAEQTAEAYYYMGLAGWDAEQLIAGLPGVMSLAAASGESLQSVSEVLVTSLSALGMTADDTQTLVDILATTATNAVTDVGQMGQAFKYAAQQAGALGIDADDLALTLGLLADQAITGTSAGTMVRTMFTRLSANVSGARDTFESLGTTVFDEQGRMRDWSTILEEARVGWAKLTDEQKQQYAYTITGMRGISGLNALLGATEEKYIDLKTAIDGAAGSAKEMADTRLDNLWGDIQMFNSSFDVLKHALFEDVKAPLRDVVQYATDALDRITDKVEEDGLIGGIRQLGTEIKDFTEKYKDEIHELAKVVGQLIEVAFEELLPSLSDLAVQLGSSFATGLLDGIYTGYGDSKFGFLRSIANFLGYGGRTPIFGTMPEGAPSDEVYEASLRGVISEIVIPETVNYGGVEIPLSEILKVDVDQLSKNIETSINENGGMDVEIGDGWILSIEAAQKLRDDLINGVFDPAGTDGGAEMAENAGEQLKLYTPTITSDLAGALSGIGPDVGNSLSYSIDDKLRNYDFRINVRANVTNSQTNGAWSNGETFTASNAQEFTVPRSNAASGGNTIIMTLNGTEVGRAFLPYIQAEQQRVGVSLSKGGTL